MYRAPLIAAIAVVVASAAAVAGCGGSGGASDDPFGRLSAHLPPDTPAINAIDVDAARSELGLSADADATDVRAAFGSGISEQDPLQRLVRATGIGFPAIGQELQGVGNPTVIDAVDGSQVHAVAATGQGDIQVTALATSQSFDSIAEKLADQGYTRDGDVLAAADSQQPIGGLADAGDGVVIIARSAQLAAEAADEQTGPTAVAGLLGAVDGPVRLAAAGRRCISGIAVGQSADSSEGSAVVDVAGGDADPAKVDTSALDATDSSFTFSAPKTDGSRLTIDYEGQAPKVEASTPLEGLVLTFTVYSAYNCG